MTTSQQQPTLSRRERRDLRMMRLVPPRLSSSMSRRIIRMTGWRAGSRRRGIPIGLLTTTGRRSGKRRTTPLMYLEDDGRFFVVPSNSGFDHHPDWFLNLLASPSATFEVDGEEWQVRASVLAQAEASDRWPGLVAHNPLWGAYQELTDRRLSVVSLDPI